MSQWRSLFVVGVLMPALVLLFSGVAVAQTATVTPGDCHVPTRWLGAGGVWNSSGSMDVYA